VFNQQKEKALKAIKGREKRQKETNKKILDSVEKIPKNIVK
jgi:hypothetical protein